MNDKCLNNYCQTICYETFYINTCIIFIHILIGIFIFIKYSSSFEYTYIKLQYYITTEIIK